MKGEPRMLVLSSLVSIQHFPEVSFVLSLLKKVDTPFLDGDSSLVMLLISPLLAQTW